MLHRPIIRNDVGNSARNLGAQRPLYYNTETKVGEPANIRVTFEMDDERPFRSNTVFLDDVCENLCQGDSGGTTSGAEKWFCVNGKRR